MKPTLSRWWLLSLLALSACGGEVNLGNRTDSGPASPSDDDPPHDPYWPKTERVVDLAQRGVYGPLAVAGDFLYAAGYASTIKGSLFRCKKTSCTASWERLPSVHESMLSLQVVEQRLAVAASDAGQSAFFGSYALPDVTDRQVVIEGIPAGLSEFQHSRFHRGFVYWPLQQDDAHYRCAVPSCAPGPRKIADSWGDTPVAFDADSVFVPSNDLILRIGGLGDGPVERLLPDATLSAAPTMAEDETEPVSVAVKWLATSKGMLYATLAAPGCDSGCPTRIVRWPATGGPREELFVCHDGVNDLFVLDGEMVWLNTDSYAATLSSCRAEACSSTLRHLGVVPMYSGAATSDEERLYWLEGGRDPEHRSVIAIRSVKRLPAPDGD